MHPLLRRYLCIIGLGIVAVSIARGRLPAWSLPLLAENVTDLGRGYRSVVLADICAVHYGPNKRQKQIYHGAMRIQTEEGRARARCDYFYNADIAKITAARAWIVSADGKETESVDITEFIDTISEFNGTFWPQQRRLTFSAADRIQVGGAFVWELEEESQVDMFGVTWDFPYDLPTLVSSLDVTPPAGGSLAWHASLPSVPTATTAANGSAHWEERHFRPKRGGDRPTGFLPTRRFVCVRAESAGTRAPNTWAEVARLSDGIIEPRIAMISPELVAKASTLTALKATRWQKIQAIADFVQREIAYLGVTLDKDSFAGYRPHAAAEVLNNRYGDCKDKATLLVAMLRTINEKAYPVLIFAGNPRGVVAEWPSPRFNHAIVCIPADNATPDFWPRIDGGPLGPLVVFDPTDTEVPLGLLPDDDQAGWGLVVAQESSTLVQLPKLVDRRESVTGMTIDPNGDTYVQVTERSRGVIAAEARHRCVTVSQEKYTQKLEARLHGNVTSLHNLKWDQTWDADNTEWKLHFTFTANRHSRRAGNLLFVIPQFSTANERLLPWKIERDGVVWSAAGQYRDEVRIVLPAGSEVDELPDEWNRDTSDLKASINYRREGDVLICTFTQSETDAFLDRERYEALRDCLQKTEEAQQRPVVLRCPNR